MSTQNGQGDEKPYVWEPVPLFDRVKVKLLDKQEKSRGGIIIPDKAQRAGGDAGDMVWVAEVQAIGDGFSFHHGRKVEIDVKVGDRVLVPKLAGVKYQDIGGDAVYLVDFEQIISRLKRREATPAEVEAMGASSGTLAEKRAENLQATGKGIGS